MPNPAVSAPLARVAPPASRGLPVTGRPDKRPRLHVIAIGGPHQFAHFIPVACEMRRAGHWDVRIFAPDEQDAQAIVALADKIGLPAPAIQVMRLPGLLERHLPQKVRKGARLLAWARRIRAADALLCAERTSTMLKRLPGRCPPIIHIPHGAGDRAVGFEPRFALFDHVLVAGDKDRDRLIASGRVAPKACAVVGPIKIAAMLRAGRAAPRLFDNDRPTILYNPHFNRKLGSFDAFARRLIDAVARDGRYNLVVAPHVRLAEGWSEEQRRIWTELSVPGRIIVDLGSERSIDMSYTLGADLYIGDVSSQVYEYLIRPRPCLFINSHDADWRDNADYAMWRFGPVATPDCDIDAALRDAFASHDQYRAVQVEKVARALAHIDTDAAGGPSILASDPIAVAASHIDSLFAPTTANTALTAA